MSRPLAATGAAVVVVVVLVLPALATMWGAPPSLAYLVETCVVSGVVAAAFAYRAAGTADPARAGSAALIASASLVAAVLGGLGASVGAGVAAIISAVGLAVLVVDHLARWTHMLHLATNPTAARAVVAAIVALCLVEVGLAAVTITL